MHEQFFVKYSSQENQVNILQCLFPEDWSLCGSQSSFRLLSSNFYVYVCVFARYFYLKIRLYSNPFRIACFEYSIIYVYIIWWHLTVEYRNTDIIPLLIRKAFSLLLIKIKHKVLTHVAFIKYLFLDMLYTYSYTIPMQ